MTDHERVRPRRHPGGRGACRAKLLPTVLLLLATAACGERAPAPEPEPGTTVEGGVPATPEATPLVPPEPATSPPVPPAVSPPEVPAPPLSIAGPSEVEGTPRRCECASSPALFPLGCDSGESYRGSPAISDDGRTIVFDACSMNGLCDVFRWTAPDGEQRVPSTSIGAGVAGLSPDGDLVLMSPNPDTFGAEALVYRVSDDRTFRTGLRPEPVALSSGGSVVGLTLGTGSPQLARWRPDTGRELLGELPQAVRFTLLGTPDSEVIAGVSHLVDGSQPFRWTPEQGLELGLADVPLLYDTYTTLSLSRDGSTLLGYFVGDDGLPNAFRWTRAEGARRLLGGAYSSSPIAASSDASILALSHFDPINPNCEGPGRVCNVSALRWTDGAEAELLTPGTVSYSRLISAQGTRIVGYAGETNPVLFDWTPERGARNVQLALEAAGVDATGWRLEGADALSRDGKVLVGRGMCGGRGAVFRTELPD